MARKNVGAIFKGKDGKADYIQISEDITLKKGEYLNLDSKASKIASITDALEKGKLSEEIAEKMLEKANNMKDFIRFEITKNVTN